MLRQDVIGDRDQLGLVKVVGPCKSGKSTLVTALRKRGYEARACSQEHSQIPDMWRRISPPAWLIYLDVTAGEMRRRSRRSDWTDRVLAHQQQRLHHARQHADLYIQTDNLSPIQILDLVMAFFAERI